jgi:uncharacterized protein YoxC
MNNIWLGLIAVAVAATAFFLILLLIELRRTTRTLSDSMKTTEESMKTTLEELQQTLKNLRDISDNIKAVTGDIKTFSGAVKDVGQDISHMSNLVENFTSSALIKASCLKVGVKTAFGVLLHNLFNSFFKKGDRQ